MTTNPEQEALERRNAELTAALGGGVGRSPHWRRSQLHERAQRRAHCDLAYRPHPYRERGKVMITVDGRCTHRDCSGKGIYRMVGYCSNCGQTPVLILFTEGHETSHEKCPTCGNWRSVKAQRLATEDEIPEGR